MFEKDVKKDPCKVHLLQNEFPVVSMINLEQFVEQERLRENRKRERKK